MDTKHDVLNMRSEGPLYLPGYSEIQARKVMGRWALVLLFVCLMAGCAPVYVEHTVYVGEGGVLSVNVDAHRSSTADSGNVLKDGLTY